MADDEYEDRVADALLSDSIYERVRFQRPSLFNRPIPRKLRWQSGLLFALSGVLPLLATVPPEARELFPAGDPLSATTKILVLGIVGGCVTFATGLGLVGVALLIEHFQSKMTEARAHMLLSLEEVASSIGLITGGAAIGITLAFHLLGLGGEDAVGAYIELTGSNPFAGVGIEMPVAIIAGAAAIGGLLLFTASQALVLRGH